MLSDKVQKAVKHLHEATCTEETSKEVRQMALRDMDG